MVQPASRRAVTEDRVDTLAAALIGHTSSAVRAALSLLPLSDFVADGDPGTYLDNSGGWSAPPDTSYEEVDQAAASDGTATGAGVISAAVLRGAIQRWVTGSATTAISAIGQALNRAATAAEARDAIGAGTSNLTLGTTASTARAGNWVPTKADVGLGNVNNTSDAAKPISTAVAAELDKRPPIVKAATLPSNPDPNTVYLLTGQ